MKNPQKCEMMLVVGQQANQISQSLYVANGGTNEPNGTKFKRKMEDLAWT